MSTYYIREGQGNWEKTKAASIAGAKRAATRAQMFQGTNLFVGEESGGRVWPVAAKYADPINMDLAGNWQAVDAELMSCGEIGVA